MDAVFNKWGEWIVNMLCNWYYSFTLMSIKFNTSQHSLSKSYGYPESDVCVIHMVKIRCSVVTLMQIKWNYLRIWKSASKFWKCKGNSPLCCVIFLPTLLCRELCEWLIQKFTWWFGSTYSYLSFTIKWWKSTFFKSSVYNFLFLTDFIHCISVVAFLFNSL